MTPLDVAPGLGASGQAPSAVPGGQTGGELDRAQELMLDHERRLEGVSQAECLDGQERLPSTMDAFRDVISKQLDREQALDDRKRQMIVESTDPSGEPMADFAATAKEMMTLQMAYHEKSMGSALILSTAKSAEGFCKTLMRSQ